MNTIELLCLFDMRKKKLQYWLFLLQYFGNVPFLQEHFMSRNE
jgi:hypothetical protein